jgi:hypothetical protein
LLQVFKSGDEHDDPGMSVEDYPSHEVALRVQLQRAIEEERSARSRGAVVQQKFISF